MSVNNSKLQEYGSSLNFGNYILKHQLDVIQPRSIVDFGAGAGKNGRIVRQILPDNVKLVAVEGCEKTALMLTNKGQYNEVNGSLIQKWVLSDPNSYDLAIFGDVLEHLTPKEIHMVLGKCLNKFKHIVVICPLQDIFQDDAYGNQLEVHKTYITNNFFDRYNIIDKHIVKKEGVSILNIHILSEYKLEPIYRKFSWFVFHRIMLLLQPLGLARAFVNILKRYAVKYKWLLRK